MPQWSRNYVSIIIFLLFIIKTKPLYGAKRLVKLNLRLLNDFLICLYIAIEPYVELCCRIRNREIC